MSADASRKYRLKNPEKVRETQRKAMRAWREADPERSKQALKSWRDANPAAAREITRRANAKRRGALVGRVSTDMVKQKVKYWGEKCWMCGGLYEHLDHVKPIARGGVHILANLRPACATCNKRKGAHWAGVNQLVPHRYKEYV